MWKNNLLSLTMREKKESNWLNYAAVMRPDCKLNFRIITLTFLMRN